MMSLPVVWATDAAYARHAAASIHSVLGCEPSAEAHVLLAPDVSDGDVRRFGRLSAQLDGRVTLHRFDGALVTGLPTMAQVPAVMWYRIHLPAVLPDVPRALYLDADTIAMQSVRPLFDADLGEALIAAVDNVTQPGVRDVAGELGIAPEQRYFNSGVLVMDLDEMRRADCTRAITAAAERPLVWPDQDALNIALGHRRQVLHPRWNAQNSLFAWTDWAHEVFGSEAVAEATAAPAIVHFEGHGVGTKPWDDRCRHPFRATYLRHARSTPWPAPIDVVSRARRRTGRLLQRAVRPTMGR
jgi:lipopolysaccharide biosynthesis glycosyltransferase